jgi:hypothetical protein
MLGRTPLLAIGCQYANMSHDNLQKLFQNITGNPRFNLENDAFHGANDLQVSLTSQAGGIHSVFRQPDNSTIPIGSETYNNTIHAQNFMADYGINHELGSYKIANDVVALLNSPNVKFSPSIGNGMHCNLQ